MPQSPSPAAIKGQALMFRLLTEHFDAESGTYTPGWSDAKVATDAHLSLDHVSALRDELFGPLKEPPELAKLAADIEALAGLIDEAVAPIKSELAQMRQRLADVRRRFPA